MGRVKEVTDALVALSLGVPPGTYLGAEIDLLERLQVSRPTLRQAAKIAESDRLLQVRKGMRGGYYAARPDATDAIRAPARYLRLNGGTIVDVQATTALVMVDAAAQAANFTDPKYQADLIELRNLVLLADTPQAMIRADIDLARLIALMSGSPTAQLFIEIGYTFGREEEQGQLYRNADDRKRARDMQIRLIDALLDGDPDFARLLVRRRTDMIAVWLKQATV